MNTTITYLIIAAVLFVAELCYFKVADKCNIIDKPNERSSHTRVVLRGGGIIFLFGVWIWSVVYGFQYPWFLAGVTLAAGISFVDDIHSLPDLPRLMMQFVAMILMFVDLGLLQADTWWMVPIALIVCVGAVNVYNFMDGINGITGGYSLAVLIPLAIENGKMEMESGSGFVDESLLTVIGLSVLVFCFFNFRNKAKCFAGDVGSVGMAFIILFALGKLILATEDLTYFLLLSVYGVDAIMTILHRILLKEHLGEAHRKHAYQIMANELKIPHTIVASFYAVSQLAVSLGLILSEQHWLYFLTICVALIVVYLVFMKQYYHLHAEYLQKVKHEN